MLLLNHTNKTAHASTCNAAIVCSAGSTILSIAILCACMHENSWLIKHGGYLHSSVPLSLITDQSRHELGQRVPYFSEMHVNRSR
jgi:uncharacterized protein YsxB (DUF464 family)